MTERIYDTQSASFYFRAQPRDFSVEELPLYEASGSGEHIMIKVRKKGMQTPALLERMSAVLGVKRRDIGHAGLKDKHAITKQYLSLPAIYEKSLHKIEGENIKILEVKRHANKLRIGHLRGNRFFMRLKKVDRINASKILANLEQIKEQGFYNYFGHQRFSMDNIEAGRELTRRLASGSGKVRLGGKDRFRINAYQSELFNAYLAMRATLAMAYKRSKSLRYALEFAGIKGVDALDRQGLLEDTMVLSDKGALILNDDLLSNFPKGGHIKASLIVERNRAQKASGVERKSHSIASSDFSSLTGRNGIERKSHSTNFATPSGNGIERNLDSNGFGSLTGENSIEREADSTTQIYDFKTMHTLLPTGPLFGVKMPSAGPLVLALEAGFCDERILAFGARRYLCTYPSDIEVRYIEERAWLELHFTLAKGSYATIMLEALARGMADSDKVIGGLS